MAQATLATLCDDVRARVREAADGPDDAALSQAVAVQILVELGQLPEKKRRLDRDLLRDDVVYAIPDGALELVPSYVKAAIACFSEGPHAAVPELVGLLVRYEQLKVKLTGAEAAVVRVLKNAAKAGEGALAVADIRDRLTGEKSTVDVKEVHTLLKKLQAKGTDKATLVRETDGRWSAGNV